MVWTCRGGVPHAKATLGSLRDGAAGRATHGAVRYLLDTVKGAELGRQGDALVVHLGCAHNPSWPHGPDWAASRPSGWTLTINAPPGAASWETGRMTNADRDRDTEGRAHQARPRDTLGRPLPYGAEGVEPVSEEPLPPRETLEAARELVGAGRPFSAHEVMEARWKAGPVEERDLWQGLAQVCVALTHAARGNRVGADRLFERAAERLTAFAATGRGAYGLDLDVVVEQARRHGRF